MMKQTLLFNIALNLYACNGVRELHEKWKIK
jgi:hypothetical protein